MFVFHRSPIRRSFVTATQILVLASLTSSTVPAANGTWTRNGNGNWSTTSNWSGRVVANGAGFTAFLSNVINQNRTITLDSNRTIGNIYAQDTNRNYTIGGTNTLTLAVLSGSPVLDVVSGRTLTINPIVAGTQGLTKANAGTVVLSGTNTYTGSTIVSAGTLQAGAAAGGQAFGNLSAVTLGNATNAILNLNGFNQTIGSLAGGGTLGGNVTLGGGTLTFGGDNSSTVYGGIISGAGNITKVGNGTFAVTATQTYNGTTTISAGTLQLGNGGTTGQLTAPSNVINNATYAVNRSNTLQQGPTSVISGTGVFLKLGTGTFTMSGTNSYSGGTVINAGTLTVDNTSALGSTSGSLTVNTGGTLNLANFNLTVGNLTGTGGTITSTSAGSHTLTIGQGNTGGGNYQGVISDGSGTTLLTKTGTGTITLSGNNEFSGQLAVSNGTLQVATLNNANTVGPLGNSSLAIQLGGSGTTGTLSYTGSTTTSSRSFTAVAGGTGRITTTGGTTLTFAGTLRPDGNLLLDGPGNYVISSPMSSLGTGTLTKNGTGRLTLSSTGAHSGGFVINQGTLDITSATALTNATSLAFGNGVTLDNSTGSLVAVTNNTMTKSLGNALTYLGSGNADISLGGGTTTLTSNITFDVVSNDLTFDGPTVGSGVSIVKNGNGTLRFTDLQSGALAGNSTVSGGTFRIAGTSTVGSNVTITVNTGALLSIDGTATWNGTYVLNGGQIETDQVQNTDAVFNVDTTLTSFNGLFNGTQTIVSNVTVTSIADRLGTVPAVPTTGRIVMQGNATLASTGDIDINANKGIALSGSHATFNTSGGVIQLNSQVTGTGKLIATGSSAEFMDIVSTNNTYAGGTDILSGVLGIMGDGSLGAGGTSVFIGDGATLASAQPSLNGTVTVSANRSVFLANGGTSRLAARTFSTLAVDGVIDEQFFGPVSELAINEFGVREGKVVLGGANLYGGDTIVTAGTLLVNNTTGSGTGTGNVIVNAGATLGGTGSIAGSVTIQNGATLSPGASIASLASGTVTFENNSSFLYEIDSTALPSVGADLQIVSGDLALSGTVTLNLVDLASSPMAVPENTIFTLFNYAGTWNGGLVTVDGNTIADGGTFTVGLNTWQLDYNASAGGANFSGEYVHANFVNIIAVPEPPVVAMLAAGGVVGWLIRRRRVVRGKACVTAS
jgi:autotransporter-associated beta strand protein